MLATTRLPTNEKQTKAVIAARDDTDRRRGAKIGRFRRVRVVGEYTNAIGSSPPGVIIRAHRDSIRSAINDVGVTETTPSVRFHSLAMPALLIVASA